MKWSLVFLTLMSLLLAACNGTSSPDREATAQSTIAVIETTQPTERPTPPQTEAPTSTVTPTPTETPEPTDTPTPTQTPTPEPTSVTWAIDPYLDGVDPALGQPILDTFMADGMVSPREAGLLRALATYPHQAQQQIVDAGLVDEYYASSRTAEQILANLSTPHVVVFYLDQFFTYEPQFPVVYLRALPAIELGSGGCIRYAQIGAEALVGNGYTSSAWNMVVNITSPGGHNVTLFREPSNEGELLAAGKYYIITNGEGKPGRLGNGAVLLGPYATPYEAGLDVEDRGYTPQLGDFRLLTDLYNPANSPLLQVTPP